MSKSADKEANQQRFLAIFPECLSISAAARVVGISDDVIHKWRREDENFRAAFDLANINRGDLLEERMFNALDWVASPDNYKLLIQKPALFIVALKASKDKYRERGVGGDDELRRMMEEILKIKDTQSGPKTTARESTDQPRLTTELEAILDNLDDFDA